MRKALVIVNAEVKADGAIYLASPATEKMVMALEKAITSVSEPTQVEIIAAASLWSRDFKLPKPNARVIYCPLTVDIPTEIPFPGQKIYQDCKDVFGRRQWVEQTLGYQTNMGDSWFGDLWLPVALTTKGLVYGNVIGEGAMPNSYEQPIDLEAALRRSLHDLAAKLLTSLDAPPSVYLVQFRLLNQTIVFDRLWPFPAAPTIASLRGQQPDLFAWYWSCLTHQPILEMTSLSS